MEKNIFKQIFKIKIYVEFLAILAVIFLTTLFSELFRSNTAFLKER